MKKKIDSDGDMLERADLLLGRAYTRANGEGVPGWLKPFVDYTVM